MQRSLGMAVATAQWLLIAGANAADSEPSTEEAPQEVVVTARLRNEKASETPAAVVPVTGEQLDQQGITNLTNIGNLVPTVAVANGFILDSLYIRGVGTSALNAGFEQQVGLFVDGVYYGNGHWLNGAYVDVDTAEVLKGPQGVYLGKNTIAGAFNISSKNPGRDFESYVKLGYEENAEEKYGQAVISGPLSDTLGARLVVRASDMQGWANQYVTGEKLPGSKDLMGRATFEWTPSDKFDALFKVWLDGYHGNGRQDLATIFDCGGPNNTPAPLALPWGPSGGLASCKRDFQVSNAQLDENGRHAFTRVESQALSLKANWKVEYGVLTSISAWNKYDLESFGLSGISALANGSGFIPGEDNSKNAAYSEQLRFQTNFDSPVNYLIGAYYQHTSFEAFEQFALMLPSIQGAPWSTIHDNGGPGKSVAAFAEAQWAISPKLELDASVRQTHESKDFFWTNLAVAPPFAAAFPARSISDSQSNNNTSPQAILQWKATDHVMAYAAFKTGFLAGGYGATGTLSAGQTAADFRFGPEKVRGFEAGVKATLWDRKLYVDLNAFTYRYSDLQVNTYNAATTTFTVQNAADAISQGIELSGLYRLGHGFKLNGNVNYTDAHYLEFFGACLGTATRATCNVPTSTPGVFEQDFSNTPTDFAATWAGRLAVEYDGMMPNDWALHAGAGVTATENYLISQYPVQPGYGKLDAQTSVSRGAWNFALIGQNLTNRVVYTQAQGRPLSTAPQELQVFIGRGREVRFEATYQFN